MSGIDFRNRKYWSDEEIGLLADNFEDMTTNDLMLILPGRSQKSIDAKANTMGLKKRGSFTNRRMKPAPKREETEFDIIKMENMSDVERNRQRMRRRIARGLSV